MPDLAEIFGSEIVVYADYRIVERQQSGFAGSAGITDINLGTRGYSIIIKGVIRASGEDYDSARQALNQKFNEDIEPLLSAEADTYNFGDDEYEQIIWEKINLVPDSEGKVYHWNADGEMIAQFVAQGRALI